MPHRAEQGFALLEVLIALAITALVVAGASAVLNQSTHVLQRVRSQGSDAENDEVLRLRLNDLMMTLLDRSPLRGESRAMRFEAWMVLPGGVAGQATVQLVAGTGGSAAQIGVDASGSSGRNGAYGWPMGPTGIRYLNPSNRWQDSWNEPGLPRLIMLEFGARPVMLIRPRWHRSCAGAARDLLCAAEAAS